MTNAPHIITSANGRTYDLTALETPPCLLPNDVREALEAWPHGLTRLYSSHLSGNPAWKDVPAICRISADAAIHRARPAPKVTEHVLWWYGGRVSLDRWSSDTHKITMTYTGDTLPYEVFTSPSGATITVEKAE